MSKRGYIIDNPTLMAEWDWEKNNELGLDPAKLTEGQNVKAWWKCKLGHQWQATLINRGHGRGCPYCSGRKILVGYNDLGTTHPNIAKQWHPTKNGELLPTHVSAGSGKIVWWICESGHEWQATVLDRSSGGNCPYCSNRRVLAGYNDLATVNPELAKEWHPTKNGCLKPKDVLPKSKIRVWWLCKCGYEWEATIDQRNDDRRPTGCPRCAGKAVISGVNDLATINPILAKEWHPIKNGTLTPSDVLPRSNKKVWWMCEYGHEWEAAIAHRNNGEESTGCPYCSGRQATAGVNDLATIIPELVQQWHPTKNGDLMPCDVTAHSNKKVWWICENGHEWEAVVHSRSIGHGCPICFSERQTSFPEQAIYFYLKQIMHAINRYKYNGKIEIDIYLPDINVGIEYNGGYWHDREKTTKRDIRKNEILTNAGIHLIRIKEVESVELCSDEDKIIYCVYDKHYNYLNEVIKKIMYRLYAFTSNAFNTDIDVFRDFTCILEQYVHSTKEYSLAETHPEIASEWHPTLNGGMTPQKVTSSSQKQVWWKCKICNYEWQCKISNRIRNNGCPVCAKRKGLSNISICVYCAELHVVYQSIAAALRQIGGVRLSEYLRGKSKSAGKHPETGEPLHWYYVYDQTQKDGTVIKGAISLGLITEEWVNEQLTKQN